MAIAAAILMLAITALFTAARSHSQFLGGYSREREEAANISRIGAQQLDIEALDTTGERKIDRWEAERAMRRYVAGLPGVRIEDMVLREGYVEITVSVTVTALSEKTRTVSSTAKAEPFTVDE